MSPLGNMGGKPESAKWERWLRQDAAIEVGIVLFFGTLIGLIVVAYLLGHR